MDGVKALRLRLVDVQHLHPDNAESVLQQRVDDVARAALFDGIRLNDGKSALQCLHDFVVKNPLADPYGAEYIYSAKCRSRAPEPRQSPCRTASVAPG